MHEWVTRLTAVGIGAHAVQKVEHLMQDAWVRQHGLSLTQHIEGLGEMTMPGVAARLSRTPLRVGKPVDPVGSDAAAVLNHSAWASDSTTWFDRARSAWRCANRAWCKGETSGMVYRETRRAVLSAQILIWAPFWQRVRPCREALCPQKPNTTGCGCGCTEARR